MIRIPFYVQFKLKQSIVQQYHRRAKWTSPAFKDTICNPSLTFENMPSQQNKWECSCFFMKLVIVALSLMVCHFKSVSFISMHLGFIEMNMAFLRKRKRNCIAITLFSVIDHYIYTKNSDVHHYENSCNNECHDAVIICWIIGCGKKLILFADCELHLYPSPGLCNHWRQCATLFTHSVNMDILSLKD